MRCTDCFEFKRFQWKTLSNYILFLADRCRFFHRGSSGNLASFKYQNAQTCTWVIETPLGTNAFVEVNKITIVALNIIWTFSCIWSFLFMLDVCKLRNKLYIYLENFLLEFGLYFKSDKACVSIFRTFSFKY